jgi:TonB-dependent SusC/RagA subfamily outer membrane receptor
MRTHRSDARTFRLLPVLMLAALSACGGGATGQPAPDSPARTTEGVRNPDVADADELAGTSAVQAEELLAGRFPGVQVVRVPGGISVRIRGGTSALGNNEPLFIVDGLQVQATPGGALVGISPLDIARIEVLKDIGATALYGVRGANGVVVITTRRGPR